MHKKYREVLRSLQPFLENQNYFTRGGKRIGNVQRKKRRTTLTFLFKQLRDSKYRLNNVTNFKERHIIFLFDSWIDQGLSASTIQNRCSILRIFGNDWLRKAGMIKSTIRYYKKNPQRVKRSSIVKKSKCWSDRGVIPKEKIAEIAVYDTRVALQLEFQLIFKLRKKESFLLKPNQADIGNFLSVQWGTKGGRNRHVNIDTQEKMELLNRAKSIVKLTHQSLIPESKTLKEWEKYYENVLNKFGVNKKTLDITSHGLRHQGANDMYEQISGRKSPVRDGNKLREQDDLDDMHDIARDLVSLELGHSRREITSNYIGSL